MCENRADGLIPRQEFAGQYHAFAFVNSMPSIKVLESCETP